MKFYREFNIITTPFYPDLIASLLWQVNPEGIEEGENFIKVFFKENSLINKAAIQKLFALSLEEKILSKIEINYKKIKNKNWNKQFEKTLKVFKVTEKIIIKPPQKPYRQKGNEIVITIEPKMSFGTGEHQTTKLMVMLIEKYVKDKMKILDVGTGTGILAIASAKLGANKVIGIDNDEWCYENGIENIFLNNVSDKVEIRTCELKNIKERNFDLILANIQKNVLIELACQFSTKLKTNGLLILSGLLLTDKNDIIKKYASFNFHLLECKQLDEWLAIALIKK